MHLIFAQLLIRIHFGHLSIYLLIYHHVSSQWHKLHTSLHLILNEDVIAQLMDN